MTMVMEIVQAKCIYALQHYWWLQTNLYNGEKEEHISRSNPIHIHICSYTNLSRLILASHADDMAKVGREVIENDDE